MSSAMASASGPTTTCTTLPIFVTPCTPSCLSAPSSTTEPSSSSQRNRVMHPSHEVSKTYRTWVTGDMIEKAARSLRRPMEIDGYTIRPAGVDLVQCFPGGALLSITIREGRNRQVRKMCEQVGLKVTRLVRVAEGGLQLGDLKSGCWRHLTKDEICAVLAEED